MPARSGPVGAHPPNARSRYDMHDDVWEWVRDRHCPDPEGAVAEPIGACDSDKRVIR